MKDISNEVTAVVSVDSNSLRTRQWRPINWICLFILRQIAIGVIIIVILIGIGIGWLGSWNAVLAWLHNDALAVDSKEISFGDIMAGNDASASFVVTNVSSIPITVWGAQTSCGCISAHLPVTINPYEKIEIVFAIKNTRRVLGEDIHHQALLYLSEPSRPVLLSMRGKIVKE